MKAPPQQRDDPGDEPTADERAPAGSDPRAASLRIARLPRTPWVYRKMVFFPERGVPNGSYIPLHGRDRKVLGHGFLNRRSEIAFRVFGSPTDAHLSPLLRARIIAAHDLRTQVLQLHRVTDAARIISAEADGLPGLIVDRYRTTLVVLIYALGWVAHAELLEAELRRLPDVDRVIFIADKRSAELEGFSIPPPEAGLEAEVDEHGITFEVDLAEGHKTGLFLDQRDNRALLARHTAGKTVLDLCTNAGGFALHARKKGAANSVTGVDLDEKALARARRNARRNKAEVVWAHADLFPWLRDAATAKKRWDVVILDPPRLATGKGEVEKGLRIYADMNKLAFGAVAPGGLLFTFSCSGAVSEQAFIETVADAADAAGRRARVLQILGPAPDHPFALDFLEGRYLKGLMLHVS